MPPRVPVISIATMTLAPARDALKTGLPAHPGGQSIAWRVDAAPVPYERALAVMAARATAVAEGSAPELAWLLEHPPLYTAGTSARDQAPIDARFPDASRRPRRAAHLYGPGQRILYAADRPQEPCARRAALRGDTGGSDHPHACRLQRLRRAPRGPHRRLVRRPDKGEGHEDKMRRSGFGSRAG